MRHSFAPFDREMVAFLSAATGVDFSNANFGDERQWLCVSCRDDDGRLMGLCAFEFKTWFDAYFSIAVRDPRCINRRVMRAMFAAVFSQAVRVSAEVPPDHVAVIEKAKRMGFEIEGYKRLAIEGRQDALLLGMTLDTCKALRASPRASLGPQKGKTDGKLTQAA